MRDVIQLKQDAGYWWYRVGYVNDVGGVTVQCDWQCGGRERESAVNQAKDRFGSSREVVAL
jgi:hypothetical protein